MLHFFPVQFTNLSIIKTPFLSLWGRKKLNGSECTCVCPQGGVSGRLYLWESNLNKQVEREWKLIKEEYKGRQLENEDGILPEIKEAQVVYGRVSS